MSTDSRSSILGRIRAAQPSPATKGGEREPVFAPIADPMQRYLEECTANLTEVVRTRNLEESASALNEALATYSKNGLIYAEEDPKVRRLVEAAGIDLSLMWSSERPIPEATEVSITLTEALIAQTGSLLTSSQRGGRGASAAPATHIVFATSDQVLPDLDAALQFVMERNLADTCSFVGVITGSSRTADIEKILVQGAHGPRKLIVILQERA